MRLIGMIMFLVLGPCLVSGQSLLLERGQSGMFVVGNYSWTGDVSVAGIGGGHAFSGIADLGLGFGQASGAIWAISQFLDVHVYRATDEKCNTLLVTLSEQLSIQSRTLLPSADSYDVLTIGGSVDTRLRFRGVSALLLSIGYYRMMPVEGDPPENLIGLEGGLAIYGGSKVVSITIGVFSGGDNTAYGLTLSIGDSGRRVSNGNISGGNWE